MSTMLVELYDALKEAGASEAKARAAAESLVLGRDRLERIEEQTGRLPKVEADLARVEEHTGEIPKMKNDLARVEEHTGEIPKMKNDLARVEEHTGEIPKMKDDLVRLDKELAVVKAQIDLLKWMNGVVIAGVLALIIKTFFA